MRTQYAAVVVVVLTLGKNIESVISRYKYLVQQRRYRGICLNLSLLCLLFISLYIYDLVYILRYILYLVYHKIKIHSSCEIEGFVKTHRCQLCDTPIARITGCVQVGDSPWNYYCCVSSLYQGQRGDVSLCAETMKPVFEGNKI